MSVSVFGMDPQRHAGADDGAQREHADRADGAREGSAGLLAYNRGFRHWPETRHSSVCPSTNSRNRSPGCPSSPGCICTSTRLATRFTSARRGRCATGCGTISAPTAAIRRPTRCWTRSSRLEVIVTDSVVEALALENNLIKQRAPKYNILLRDDKNYPYLQLTTNEAFPRVLVARRVERDGSFYAGPFLPAHFARRTMALTHRLFGIRSCNEVITGKRERPCLEYDIKRCLAPCVDDDLHRRGVRPSRGRHAAVPRGQERRARPTACRRAMVDAAGRRAVRGGGAAARRDAHRADAARSAAEDGDGRARAIATSSA